MSPYNPGPEFRLTADYGTIHLPNGVTIDNPGLDFAAAAGTSIPAAADGIVYFSGWMIEYGNTVVIQHEVNGETVYTLYGELGEPSSLSAGDSVQAGDSVGIVGGADNGSDSSAFGSYSSNGSDPTLGPDSKYHYEAVKVSPDPLKEWKDRTDPKQYPIQPGDYPYDPNEPLPKVGDYGPPMYNFQHMGEDEVLDEMDDLFGASQLYIRRRDPMILDLDGDGLETIAPDPEHPILFDHTGSGVKTGTGWVSPDDGFLVLDRDGNGTIDSGRELFGDSTPLYDANRNPAGNAADGFDALAQEDTNGDGVVDSQDARWSKLRVWQDKDQDGITDDGELKTMEQAGIASIAVSKLEHSKLLPNGNEIADLGTYTRTDGNVGTVGTSSPLADVNLVEDTFHRTFPDVIELPPELQVLPDMHGSGKVRDLCQAAGLSATLADLLKNYAATGTREEQLSQLDALITAWGATSGTTDMATRVAEHGYRFVINLDATQLAHLAVLEQFCGRPFYTLPWEQAVGQVGVTGMSISTDADGTGVVTVTMDDRQQELLDKAWEVLRQSVYDSLLLQTRLAEAIRSVKLRYAGDGIYNPDFSAMDAYFQAQYVQNPVTAVRDLLDLERVGGSHLTSWGWDGYSMLKGWIADAEAIADPTRRAAVLSSITHALNDLGYTNLLDGVAGTAAGEVLTGGDAGSVLDGKAGSDLVMGGAGGDTLKGGAGDDILYGGDGSDTYVFNLGDGSDTIVESHGDTGTDTIAFGAGIAIGDLTISRDGDKLVFAHANGIDTLSVANWFGSTDDGVHRLDRVTFADGTAFDLDRLQVGTSGADTLTGTEGNDMLAGGAGSDVLSGGIGSDWLDGGAGTDRMTGGSGDDAYFVDNTGDTVVELANEGTDTVYATGSHVLSDNIENLVLQGSDPINGTGNDLANVITGNAGWNVLDGRGGADILIGRGNDDTYIVDSTSDQVVEEADQGDDTVFASASFTLSANVEDLILTGNGAIDGTGNDLSNTIVGNDSDNKLFGEGDNDGLSGGYGNDTLNGGSGNDLLDGGFGNDTLDGGAGDDRMDGGDGNDTYVFGNGYGHDVIEESVKTASDIDTLQMKEGVSPSDVTVTRDEDNLYLSMNGGADRLTLSKWLDPTNYYKINSIVFADGTVWDEAELMKRVQAGSGTQGNDTLYGGTSDDVLDGGAGDDLLDGSGGNDTYVFGKGYGQDVIREGIYTGAGGIDTVLMKGDVLPSEVMVTRDGYQLFLTIDGTGDRLTFGSSIERVVFADGTVWDAAELDRRIVVAAGTEGNDIIYGRAVDDVIMGLGGDDRLFGQGGNDTLDGGAGNDFLVGGALLLGGEGDDILRGLVDNATLDGGAGNDTLQDGQGNDTYVFGKGYGRDEIYEGIYTGDGGVDAVRMKDDVLPSEVTVTRDEYNLYLTIDATGDTLTVSRYFDPDCNSINSVVFADGTVWDADELDRRTVALGTESGEDLYGGSGNNVIDGLGGNDILYGFDGDDTLLGGEGDDSLFGSTGNDMLEGGAGNDWLDGGFGNDVLDGGAGDDTLHGGSDNDTYVFGNGYGQDAAYDYDGTSGNVDTIRMAEGVLPCDVTVIRDGNNLYLSLNGGNDRLMLGAWFQDDTKIEQVVFADGTLWDADELERRMVALGTESGEDLYGGSGDNVINGLGGDDALYGQDGNDVLDGGSGNDTLYGGSGNDTYVFGRGYGQDAIDASDTAFEDVDTVQMADGISASDVTVTHDDYNLYLSIDGGADVLTLRDWVSSRGTTVDRVVFADGTVWEKDDLYATFGQNIVGTDDSDWLTGAEGGDTLIGMGGDDWLSGGAGNNVLDGGTGDDTLNGGNGQDTYVFGDGYGHDTVTENNGYGGVYEESAVDTIRLKEGVTPSDVTITRQWDNLVLSINDGADTLTINSWYGRDPSYAYRIESIVFADGTVWDADEIENRVVIPSGTEESEALYGSDGDNVFAALGGDDYIDALKGNDILDGGTGDDSLHGGDGNDTYIFGNGYGQDEISDYDDSYGTTNNLDTVRMKEGVSASDVTVTRDEYNIYLSINDGADTLTLVDWYWDEYTRIEQVVFADGTVWDASKLEALANGLAENQSSSLLDSSAALVSTGSSYLSGADGIDGLQGTATVAAAGNISLTSWSLSTSLLDFHLNGSDTAAIGGDLAYQYAINGSLSNVSLTPAMAVLGDAQFGVGSQKLQ